MAFTKINPQVQGNQTESPNLIDGHVCFFLPLQYLSGERATARSTRFDLSLEDTENENNADAQKGGDISEEDKMEIGMTYMKVFQTRDFLENLETEIIKAKPPNTQNFKDPFVITKQRLIRDLQFCGINSFEDSDSSPSWSEGDDISDLNAKSVKLCYNNIGIFLDFMAEIFQRDSLDNRGCKVIASVNYEFNYPNAFYSSALGQVVFGTGFPMTGWMESDTKPVDDFIGIIGDFVTGIDIVAHELMHAVIQCTVDQGNGLDYKGEPGALSESIADVFAIMTQQWYSFKTDPNWKLEDSDWIIGKTAILPGHPGMGLRSLKEPGKAFEIATRTKVLKDLQIQHYDEYNDNLEVHISSGIPNKAFYEAAKEIGGFSWEKAGQIWYRALIDTGLDKTCLFSNFANSTFKEAVKIGKATGDPDLGKKVQRAWRKVGVQYDTWDD
ncbi:hypothetical protein TWF569_006227 [Orbilia oligospora]|uniref:Peptidase M4 C-terminal domain-containing protein n=1 Tax=Orbilia oligospora TaxID=2813651 RepID=A0A7C8JW78_ORBOL|nr:hypothetical protein TWF706_001781 [Orbilia oligospora]KAF3110639.1 hypothetical protein TWF102_008205 [Orbilia oligospora]KAF3114760.1 hypothetical protein TWF103_000496 [Orbilia oligospora]KAF3143460.1 hypothetical protein TWF703_010874 [Orbilia oligospora]KAF3147144.1 hypothetical protein TWF569_006227 [Orbilia oligospora]